MNPLQRIKQTAFILFFLLASICPLYGQTKSEDYIVQLTTSITENPAAITFKWNAIPGDKPKIYIHRKSKDSSDWGDPIVSLSADAVEYTDNSIETGREYEYRIMKMGTGLARVTYVSAGIKCKEVEYRGKVILLVDSTFVDTLRNELKTYEADLIGDGWDILRKDILRNASIKYVKSIIRDLYYSDTANVQAVILFGHIPVPYSGCYNLDHPDHIGAVPADIYYGDMNEKIWTDESVDCNTAPRPENRNIPGDGKFDVTILPIDEKISLQIGRIDLYNLPVFPQPESELLRNYLKKNYDFRHKINDPKLQALIMDHAGVFSAGFGGWATYAWRNFTALLNFPNIHKAEFLPALREESYIWSSEAGSGVYAPGCNTVGDPCCDLGCAGFLPAEYVKQSLRTIFSFSALGCSYAWDWDWQNSFLRSALASKSWILSSFEEPLTFHQMVMGHTIGYCQKHNANNTKYYPYAQYAYPNGYVAAIYSLLGDPTLRMHIVCPINTLHSAITADSSVLLAWKPADDSILGYYIYKLDTLENKYNKITPLPVTDTWYEDTVPVEGNNYYMVKAFKYSQVASGSYYNLSQGVFDTITYFQQTPVPVTGISLSLDPDNILPLKIYDPFIISADIIPADATNKLLKWSVENITGNGKFDVNGKNLADKGGTIAIKAEALDGSGIYGMLEVAIDSVPDAAGPIAGNTALCRDLSYQLYTIPEIRGASYYIWTLPEGITDTNTLNEITYRPYYGVSGIIKVRGHNPFADGEECTMPITINEVPPRPVVTLQGETLHSSSQVGNQWYMGSNILIEGATDSIYIPTEPGRYFVRVTINGCTSGNSNSVQYPPTGLDTENTGKILLYPNPSTGMFSLYFGEALAQNVNITVYSLHGKLVYARSHLQITTAAVDLSALPKGIYIIRAVTDEKNYFGKVCLE